MFETGDVVLWQGVRCEYLGGCYLQSAFIREQAPPGHVHEVFESELQPVAAETEPCRGTA